MDTEVDKLCEVMADLYRKLKEIRREEIKMKKLEDKCAVIFREKKRGDPSPKEIELWNKKMQ